MEQSDLGPTPSYVLSTSPDKFQVIWRVEGVTQEQAEGLLHALAREFDGDPAATDSTRVLRLPGFANKKYEEDFQVTIHTHTDRTYHPRDFKLRIEPVDSGPGRWNQSRITRISPFVHQCSDFTPLVRLAVFRRANTGRFDIGLGV